MSEEILKALMQLFAIIVKQDEGAEDSEIVYVKNFLTQQLNTEAVEEYFALFSKQAGIKKDDDKEKKKLKLTSVRDSVRILGICKKINKKLNQKQKAVVLVRLFELVTSDRKFSDQRMAIINTVAEVFNIPNDEFENIETFVIKNSIEKLDNPANLIINDQDIECTQCKHIKSDELDGNIFILRIKSVDLYFLRYTGNQDVYLNGLPLNNKRIYLFAIGSTLKLPKGKPVYYSDVVANFMADITTIKLSFVVRDLLYRFPSGDIGLRNITFSEEHGRLIGIMGASGAGKTTLLNVLSGISAPSEGIVRINSINLHEEHDQIEGVIGYIPQDDLLIEELTVYQNLYFAAKFCFKNKSNQEINNLIEDTLKNLGLFERRDLKVGSPLNKMISGGQRKRLNIALELIREPSILFVDEPTSGLSSRDSENVMDLLSELTLKGKLIFVVIHQPSSDIYKMFDKMMILDTGGYMIYHGNPVEAIIHFKKLDNQINSEVGECPTCGNVNPELIFNILDAKVVDEFGRYTDNRKVSPKKWEELFHKNIQLEEVEEIKENPPRNLNIPSWFRQFKLFSFRDALSKIANTQYIALNLLEAPLLAFILSFIIRYIADPDSNVYIFRDNVNFTPYIFMCIVVALFLGMMVSAEEIFKDRKILKREKFLNLSKSSYLLSKIIILFIISAIQTFLFVIVGNTILGIHGMTFHYWLALFTIAANSNLIGLIISSTFNSVVTIYILIPLLMIPQMVLSGAIFSFDTLNRVIGSVDKVPLLAEFMPSRWAYEALMVHQFKDNKYEKVFFDLEKRESTSNFKTVHYIPALQARVDTAEAMLDKEDNISRQKLNNTLQLIRNEYISEKNRLQRKKATLFEEIAEMKQELKHSKSPESIKKQLQIISKSIVRIENLINYPFDIQNITPQKFDDEQVEMLHEYLIELKKFYSDEFNRAFQEIDRIKNYLNETNPEIYRKTKDNYHNQTLTEIVKNVFEENPIVEHENTLIRNAEPIYHDPDITGFLNFRTHFYAPRKTFANRYFDTFWFNLIVIWIGTILFYIILYFDLIKNTLEFLGKISIKPRIPKRKPKIKPEGKKKRNKTKN